jgi:3-methyladenine DNA glycosylase AlkD
VGADLTAEAFIASLQAHRSDAERVKISRSFRGGGEIIGVRMKRTFDTAKAFEAMPLDEVEKLLDSPYYEARIGAVSIMDFKTRRKRTGEKERKALFELYLRRHDRIDSWDLVDRAAPRVVGWYLLDKPRDVLYRLARSADVWERRTAITATFWLIRQGEVDDALQIAEILLHDDEELINKSVGTGLREVGKVDRARLLDFLEHHAHDMPRVTLRYAVERLDGAEKKRLMGLAGSR